MLLLDYDAKEGQAPPCLASCTLRRRVAKADEEVQCQLSSSVVAATGLYGALLLDYGAKISDQRAIVAGSVPR